LLVIRKTEGKEKKKKKKKLTLGEDVLVGDVGLLENVLAGGLLNIVSSGGAKQSVSSSTALALSPKLIISISSESLHVSFVDEVFVSEVVADDGLDSTGADRDIVAGGGMSPDDVGEPDGDDPAETLVAEIFSIVLRDISLGVGSKFGFPEMHESDGLVVILGGGGSLT